MSGGAEGNRTPDLLDANESRYQLRHSPAAADGRRAPTSDVEGSSQSLPHGAAVTARAGVGEVVQAGVLIVEVDHRGALWSRRQRLGPQRR